MILLDSSGAISSLNLLVESIPIKYGRFNHDTHVPLILYGKGIKKGSISRKTDVIDIAPTVASVLGINSPNGSTGQVIFEAIDD